MFGTNYNIKVNDLKENYNKFNSGVDIFEQKLQITVQRKTIKWYKKVILFGINASIINSKIICDGLYGKKANTNQYKVRIIFHNFKRYQEYQDKIEKLSNKNNNYIPINYRIKIHNIEKKLNVRKYCKISNLRVIFDCKECNFPLHPK